MVGSLDRAADMRRATCVSYPPNAPPLCVRCRRQRYNYTSRTLSRHLFNVLGYKPTWPEKVGLHIHADLTHPRCQRSQKWLCARVSQTKWTQVLWWKGRVKEFEGNYAQASQFYERVHEKQPTIDRLNRLARYSVRKRKKIYISIVHRFLGSRTRQNRQPDADMVTKETQTREENTMCKNLLQNRGQDVERSQALLVCQQGMGPTAVLRLESDACSAAKPVAPAELIPPPPPPPLHLALVFSLVFVFLMFPTLTFVPAGQKIGPT